LIQGLPTIPAQTNRSHAQEKLLRNIKKMAFASKTQNEKVPTELLNMTK
jgi:hypothetical protein